MKFSRIRAMALVIVSSTFLLAATGCKKSSSNGSPEGNMTATVNGSAWSGNAGTVGVYTNIGGVFYVIGLQVGSGDTTGFQVQFVSPVTVNLSMNTDTSAATIGYSDSKSGNVYGAEFGLGDAVLNITSYDSTGHKVAGTFSGVLYNTNNYSDSILVMNGKFNSAFTVQ